MDGRKLSALYGLGDQGTVRGRNGVTGHVAIYEGRFPADRTLAG